MQAGRFHPKSASLDLALRLREGPRSALIAASAGLAFGSYMVALDATVFRAIMPDRQLVLFREWPLVVRLGFSLRNAMFDEVLLRLAGLSTVLWLAVAASGRRSPRVEGLAILFTAAVLWPLSAWSYLAALDWSLLTALRELGLHVTAGALWGWLYCRHGWLAGLIGHCCAQLVWQPFVPLLL